MANAYDFKVPEKEKIRYKKFEILFRIQKECENFEDITSQSKYLRSFKCNSDKEPVSYQIGMNEIYCYWYKPIIEYPVYCNSEIDGKEKKSLSQYIDEAIKEQEWICYLKGEEIVYCKVTIVDDKKSTY